MRLSRRFAFRGWIARGRTLGSGTINGFAEFLKFRHLLTCFVLKAKPAVGKRQLVVILRNIGPDRYGLLKSLASALEIPDLQRKCSEFALRKHMLRIRRDDNLHFLDRA